MIRKHCSRAAALILASVIAASGFSVSSAYAADEAAEEQVQAEETASEENTEENTEESAEEGEDLEGGAVEGEPLEEEADTEEGDVITDGPSMADIVSREASSISDSSVVQIRTVYQFDDGSWDEWARGTGFFIGDRYILTAQNLVDTSAMGKLYARILKERGSAYSSVGVDLSNEKAVAPHLITIILDTYGRQYSIQETAMRNGIAAVVIKEKPEINPCAFAASDSLEVVAHEKVGVKYAGTKDDLCDVKTYTDEVYLETGSSGFGINMSDELEEGSLPGAPVYNEKGYIVGMVSGGKGEITCFSGAALETFLSVNGISYKTESQVEDSKREEEEKDNKEDVEKAEAAVANKVALSEALDKAKEIDRSRYTEETVAALEEAMKEGEKVLADKGASQDDADNAAEKITVAMDNLQEVSIISRATKWVLSHKRPFLTAALLIVLLVFLATLIRSLKKKKAEAEDGEKKPKREKPKKKTAEKRKARQTDSLDTDEYADDRDIDITKRSSNRERVGIDDADPDLRFADKDDDKAQLLDEDGSLDTDILQKDSKAYLIRKDNGKRIPINKSRIIIGKERRKVDYCIGGNTTVSRTHACIRKIDNDYYIEDLNSKNFTYVNGSQIPEYSPVYIKDGTDIRLSDVEFTFHDENSENLS